MHVLPNTEILFWVGQEESNILLVRNITKYSVLNIEGKLYMRRLIISQSVWEPGEKELPIFSLSLLVTCLFLLWNMLYEICSTWSLSCALSVILIQWVGLCYKVPSHTAWVRSRFLLLCLMCCSATWFKEPGCGLLSPLLQLGEVSSDMGNLCPFTP